MDINRIRTYAAWTSLGTALFVIALAIVIRLLPRGFLPHPITVPVGLTAFWVAIIAGIIGLPRWPAAVGLGLVGLYFFFLGITAP